MMNLGELSILPNIGLVVEGQLIEAGITNYEELAACGSREAWLRIQKNDPSACIHRLLSLEGAIRGVRKTDLPAEIKAELKAFYNAHRL